MAMPIREGAKRVEYRKPAAQDFLPVGKWCKFARFFPTDRKNAQNSLDMTTGLLLRLELEGGGRNAAPSPGRAEERTNAQTDVETFKLGQHPNLVEVVEPAAPEQLNWKLGSHDRAMERSLNARMYKKQKGIVVRRENLQKHMLLKSKGLIHALMARSTR